MIESVGSMKTVRSLSSPSNHPSSTKLTMLLNSIPPGDTKTKSSIPRPANFKALLVVPQIILPEPISVIPSELSVLTNVIPSLIVPNPGIALARLRVNWSAEIIIITSPLVIP